jgi:hypothetical protein
MLDKNLLTLVLIDLTVLRKEMCRSKDVMKYLFIEYKKKRKEN